METECIDLTIGDIEFSECIVSFEYERADSGAPDQPAYGEDLTIYRVQFDMSEVNDSAGRIWCDLQGIHYHMIEKQVLDWIHAKQDQSKLYKQIEDKGL